MKTDDEPQAPFEIEIRSDRFGTEHIFEYRWAAMALLVGNGTEAKHIARPICYLVRHALELALKHALMVTDAEWHYDETGYRSFVPAMWQGHLLQPLADGLEHRLAATGNPPLSERTRRLVARLHSLDPDGQRFRYTSANQKDKTVVASLEPGTRIDLRDLVGEMDAVIDELLNLQPDLPRTWREFEKRFTALAMTQHLPVWQAPEDFGRRRSSEGAVVMPRSEVGGANVDDVVRIIDSGGLDIAWTVTGLEEGDVVLDIRSGTFRLPKGMIQERIRRGVCPECQGKPDEINPVVEEWVGFEAGVVHPPNSLPTHKADRYCPQCHNRFQSIATGMLDDE